VLDPADGVPESGEPCVVACVLERRPSLLDEGFELLDPTLRVGVREEPHVSDARVQLAEPVARGRGALRCPGRAGHGLRRISREQQRVRELQLEHDVEHVGRQQRDRSLEQVARRADVGALDRPPSRRTETFDRGRCKGAGGGVDLPELGPVAVRLLEVVADYLVLLDQVGAPLVEPDGEKLVQLGAHRFRQGLVGCVADQ